MHTVFPPVEPAAATADGPAALPDTKGARVAIAGATGYTGQELLRILGRHPGVTVSAAMSSGAMSSGAMSSGAMSSGATSSARTSSGAAVRRLPALTRIWDGDITPLSTDTLVRDADIVFLALPDANAAEVGPSLVEAGVRVIDLSGTFRLRDPAARARWYPEAERMPEGVAYGLTERERRSVAAARLVANPGCYPTATLLALAPLVEAGLLVPGADVIVDAKSGVSGAGKTPTERTHFSECHDSLSVYGVFGHRHGAEIEQGVGGLVTFTPHLVPLDRGILSTIYVRVAPGTTEEVVARVFEQAYTGETFVRLVGAALPEIKHVARTNFCDIGWRVDPSGRVILVSVIDNLLKGASGQAVQNMNVMLGIDERTGLL